MADIFLSYRSEDLPRVRPVIEALERHGLSVWWDRKIAPGKTYPQVIKEKLNAAKVVVVVWSAQSVESEWVQIEATQGKRRGILIPLMIDPVSNDIPLEFSLMEAADLVDWDGRSPHLELDALLGSVSDLLAASMIATTAEPAAVMQVVRERAHVTRREPTEVRSRAEAAYEPTGGGLRIYLTYRRADSAGYAGRLYDLLATHFGDDSVFMDVDTLQVGVDFREAIDSAIASTSAMIVVIGRSWLHDSDQMGKRRLDNPDDYVRMEIAAALRIGIPVIPVLVQGARMPSPSELPPDISGLAERHALELDDRRWRGDAERLIKGLESLAS